MSAVIKVAFCVSYDWELLLRSIPRIYKEADVICLGLDKDRHAWSCAPFVFNEAAFYAFVREVDVDKKIDIYEDDFSLPELNSRENCNRHRMLMAERMGKGGWHIQVDADEYYLDFADFVNRLRAINPNPRPDQKPLNVCCPFVPLIKKTSQGYLYVDFEDKLPEIIPMATTLPDYQRARQNGHFNFITPCYVIHETWARSDEELLFKINNWGHASEELEEKERRMSYFKLWQSLDQYNYNYIRNYHPAKAEVWPALGYFEAADMTIFLSKFRAPEFPLSGLQLTLRNNRNMARIKSIIKIGS